LGGGACGPLCSYRDAIDCISIQLEQISEVGNVTNDTKWKLEHTS
jgi:hypothetical protein